MIPEQGYDDEGMYRGESATRGSAESGQGEETLVRRGVKSWPSYAMTRVSAETAGRGGERRRREEGAARGRRGLWDDKIKVDA